MVLPELQQPSSILFPPYKSGDQRDMVRYREDSPFSHELTMMSSPEMNGGSRSLMDLVGSAASDTCSEYRSSGVRQSCSRTRKHKRPSSNHSTQLRFIVVDDPKKLKDREQVRESRRHVMLNYLDKERRNPRSTDIRVTKRSARQDKRPGSSLSPVTDNTYLSANSPPRHRLLSAPGSSREPSGSAESASSPESVLHRQTAHLIIGGSHGRTAARFQPSQGSFSLVRGIEGDVNNTRYMQTYLEHCPDPVSYLDLGSGLQPFNCWPALNDPGLNVEELKWSCSRKFGSASIARIWIPSCISASHAFLSTICISASHDDIMMRGRQAPHERSQYGSTVRMKVRSEVLALINKALTNPETATTDTTLMSVVHVLNSEIMGCDDKTMKIHSKGIHDIVAQRGGLHRLGLNGQIALVLAITMYMISALRETEPGEDFIRYAAEKRIRPTSSASKLPESPLYCRPSGYHTLQRTLSPNNPTLILLEILRQLTHAFVRASGNPHISPLTPGAAALPRAAHKGAVFSFRDKIFALPSCESLTYSFHDSHEKYSFEALRLLAIVYAHALSNEIPFSRAAAQLSAQRHASSSAPIAWHLRIKNALIKTNLSDCWGNLAGVLHLITLIAGACANPDSRARSRSFSFNDCTVEGEEGEEEEARRWLAAISVRCSVLLGFEYGGETLEMLRRLVAIEKVLANAEGEKIRTAAATNSATMSWSAGCGSYGPVREPFEYSTFADFAAEFMDELR